MAEGYTDATARFDAAIKSEDPGAIYRRSRAAIAFLKSDRPNRPDADDCFGDDAPCRVRPTPAGVLRS